MKDAEFRAFIHGERRQLIHYVRSRTQETAALDREDIVHDVLMKLLDRPKHVAPFGDLAAYVYQSVRNRVIDLARETPLSLDAETGDVDEGGASCARCS